MGNSYQTTFYYLEKDDFHWEISTYVLNEVFFREYNCLTGIPTSKVFATNSIKVHQVSQYAYKSIPNEETLKRLKEKFPDSTILLNICADYGPEYENRNGKTGDETLELRIDINGKLVLIPVLFEEWDINGPMVKQHEADIIDFYLKKAA